MPAKEPILRQDAEWFEMVLKDGSTVKVRMTLEGYRAFEAILARLVAGGL